MKRLLLQLILVTSIFILFTVAVYGQETSAKDTAETITLAIPVTDVILKATEKNTQLREKRTILLSDEEREIIKSRLDTLLFQLALLREDPRIHNTDELNLRSLENQWVGPAVEGQRSCCLAGPCDAD